MFTMYIQWHKDKNRRKRQILCFVSSKYHQYLYKAKRVAAESMVEVWQERVSVGTWLVTYSRATRRVSSRRDLALAGAGAGAGPSSGSALASSKPARFGPILAHYPRPTTLRSTGTIPMHTSTRRERDERSGLGVDARLDPATLRLPPNPDPTRNLPQPIGQPNR